MRKYRYVHPDSLPSSATEQEVGTILTALKNKQFKLTGKADRYVRLVWKMDSTAFVNAIQCHLEKGHRLFKKFVEIPSENTLLFDANVGLDPDSDEEDDDVYVEIRMYNKQLIILCNAHTHEHGKPRLPKTIL